MNMYDSQLAAGLLEQTGFEVFLENGEDDEGGKVKWRLSPRGGKGREIFNQDLRPDVVLMNTCSVREHAEERVWGRLGMLGVEKKEHPGLILGLMGCMVEEHREKLFKRFPQLDLLVGTRNIKELPAMIRQAIENRERVAKIKQDGISIEYSPWTKRESASHAWLPIITGCDKICTFCIVPLTRGREISMPADEVCREARRLAGEGVKSITLLGQNVNSYLGTRNSGLVALEKTSPEGRVPGTGRAKGSSFPELLEMLCAIDELEEISFTTSHPQDATEDLFQAIARNPKINREFHLPLQSGSDRILKRMKRLHTFAEYKAKVERLRELVPGISLTTDIICGFPGEADEDHEATKRALETLGFDGAFIYKYSVRPGTPAAKLADDVPTEIKSRRHLELLTLQRRVQPKAHRKDPEQIFLRQAKPL
jgi:tRNA-2-methylthio-N6-dimethylallyladenosine synthase